MFRGDMPNVRRPRFEFIVGLAVLVVFVISVAGHGLSRPVLLAGVVLVALYVIGRRAAPAVKQALRSSRSRPELQVQLEPDNTRPGPRPVTSLAALKATLDASGLGSVRVASPTSLVLDGAEGRRVLLNVASPAEVTAAEVTLVTNAIELALLCTDAVVARLGPVTFRADGLRMDVDGTEPHSELQRRLHDLRMQQLQRIAHELKTLDETEQPATGRKYLN